MVKKRSIFLLVLALAVVILASAEISATTYCGSVTTCNAAIQQSAGSGGVVQMNQSINYTQNGTAINLNVSNVTFDCNRLSLTGPNNNNGNNNGIFLANNSNFVENCNISDFYYGLYLQSGSNNRFTNNTVSQNMGDGIEVWSGLNDTFVGNTVNLSSTSYGVYFHNLNSSTFAGNFIGSNNNSGLFLEYSSDNNVTGNTLISNLNGIYIQSSSNNTFTNNTANANSQGGIFLSSNSSNNTFTNNTANFNQNYYGLYLQSSSNNTFTNNTANSNSNWGGICLSSNSSYNKFKSNVADSNSNGAGIDIVSGQGNILQDNNMSNNTYNFRFEDPSVLIENNISLSNTVDYNKKIYSNLSVSNYIFNSTTVPDAGILICALCNNITVKGLNLSASNEYGLYFYNTNNSHVSGIIADSNDYGIYLNSSSENNLTDNLVELNTAGGIYLDLTSANNTITNNTANSDTNGIYISGLNNTFKNNTEDLNSKWGLAFVSSDNATITNNNANLNNAGAYIYSSSGNIITNSYFEGNSYYGFALYSSNNNTFYNNLFNNSLNYLNASAGLVNFFNTTLVSGTNIIGGPKIGGNFWGNYSHPGTGFSATCSDTNNDGICDSNYTLLGGTSVDYLPLALVSGQTGNPNRGNSGGSPGSYYPYLGSALLPGTKASNGSAGSSTSNNTNSLTNSSIVVLSSASGDLTDAAAGAPSIVPINSSSISVVSFTIIPKQNISRAIVNVSEINILSNLSKIALGKAYQKFEINTIGLNDSQISSVIINFRVIKSWINENKVNTHNIYLYRNQGDGNWTELQTTMTKSDSSYYYFTAVSPGFSVYEVVAKSSSNSNLSQIKNFFVSLTPKFFRQTRWGYVFYYLLVIIVLGGIAIAVSFLTKRLKDNKTKRASKHRKK